MPSSHPAPPRTFTLEEANALLPRLQGLLKRMQEVQRGLARTSYRLTEVVRKMAVGNGYPVQAMKREIDELFTQQQRLIEDLQSLLGQLESVGCVVKDLETGLVDFYSVRGGELVFLCWKLGERRVRFWHTLEGGFAGRQPL